MDATIVSSADGDLPLGEKHVAGSCRHPSYFLCTLDVQENNLSLKQSVSLSPSLSRPPEWRKLTVLQCIGVERHGFVDCHFN